MDQQLYKDVAATMERLSNALKDESLDAQLAAIKAHMEVVQALSDARARKEKRSGWAILNSAGEVIEEIISDDRADLDAALNADPANRYAVSIIG